MDMFRLAGGVTVMVGVPPAVIGAVHARAQVEL
jgi:hypothetical protein